jgi:hypothetical protein
MHHHIAESALVDETGMIALSNQKVLMRPLNLYAIFFATERMRKLAGWRSLPQVELKSSSSPPDK